MTGLAFLIGGIFLAQALLKKDEEAAGATPPPAIAILPLQNIEPAANDDPVGEGITEAVRTDLAKLPGLSVISRRSARQFADRRTSLKEIGTALHARYVLDGSVQRSGSRIRVNVQLIDVDTGNELWGERYDRQIGDVFGLQDEIAGHIVSTISRGAMPGLSRVSTPFKVNSEAYLAYMRGLEYASRLDRSFRGSDAPTDEMAIGRLEEAVSLDPYSRRRARPWR